MIGLNVHVVWLFFDGKTIEGAISINGWDLDIGSDHSKTVFGNGHLADFLHDINRDVPVDPGETTTERKLAVLHKINGRVGIYFDGNIDGGKIITLAAGRKSGIREEKSRQNGNENKE